MKKNFKLFILLSIFVFLGVLLSCDSVMVENKDKDQNAVTSEPTPTTTLDPTTGGETTKPDPTFITVDISPIHDASLREIAMMPVISIEDQSPFLYAGSCDKCADTYGYFNYLSESRTYIKFNIKDAGIDLTKVVSAKLRLSVLGAVTYDQNFPAIKLIGINDYGVLDIEPFDGDDDWNLDLPSNGGKLMAEVPGLRTGAIEFDIPISDLAGENNYFMIKSDTLEKFYFFASSRNILVDQRPYLRLKVQQ